LAGLIFDVADEFFRAIHQVLEGINKVTLEAVLLEWIERLERCTTTNGDYTD
jgi:hypothetical protein